jgi:hypothetical protein
MWCVIVGYGVVMVVGYPAFVAKAIVHKAVTEAALEKSVPEYLPVGVDEIPREIVCGEGCGGWRKVGSGGTFEVSGGWGGVAELPLAYYPGYVAVVEESGEGLEVRVSQNGGVMVVVPDGVNGKVRVSFGYTAMRAVGYVVSIGCLGGSIWYLVRVGRVRVVIRR